MPVVNGCVIARTFQELDCWKLARQLKLHVFRLIATTRAAGDLEFCDQLRRSARSAPSNIAEGFARFKPREFAHFLRTANASLHETTNHLIDGVDSGYFTEHQIAPLQLLARRASAATTRLTRYLEGSDGPNRTRRRRPTPGNPGTT
jgi:four helix bundle protein